jgi:NADH:ubiquinone oxidoreductase subunit F (NADH-binding)/(2Fe-2S) ferredoxin
MTTKIFTAEDLDLIASAGRSTLYPGRLKVLIGSGTCGRAMGARSIEEAAIDTLLKHTGEAVVARTGCIGFCGREPLMDLVIPGGPRISFGSMTPRKAEEVITSYVKHGDVRADLALYRMQTEEYAATGKQHEYGSSNKASEIPEWQSLDFFRRQKKVILRNCGSIDPLSIEECIARGGYRGALRALRSMKPEQVIEEISASGLKGRGGAFFPTGQKWLFARKAKGDVKYLVCNADEGAPGSSMDRSVLEGDPHAIIEGMIIGSYAIGARQGYIYIRSEYPQAIAVVEKAIADAKRLGLLGDDLFGSGWSFTIEIRRGAGAYVCGEETGLIESIEGHAGEPRGRPPFPVTEGLWGKPTVVNNVKTWASVAPIVTRGAAWYSSMGTKTATGTTVFSLEGAVKNSGQVEIPFGISLRELIYGIGGGIRNDKPIKAIQVGGPSVGCIPPSMLDCVIDSIDIPGKSANMGTGGIIVLDNSACMVDMARFLMGFFVDESCGRCTPCREGVKQMHSLLSGICAGEGMPEHIERLGSLARAMTAASVCGLGNTASGPVTNALQYFREEFDAHILGGKCEANVCEMKVNAAP